MEKPKNYSLEERPVDVYVQKSMKFLYPLLGIKATAVVKPYQSYLSWNEEVGINDYNLIVVYDLRDDIEFKTFEKNVLLKHELFEDYKETEGNKGAYIFNLKKFKVTVYNFLRGKYSQIDENDKLTILDFYNLNKYSKEYMDSYMNPENYFSKYAELLNVSEELLKSVGELCNHFDRKKENLTLSILEPKI